MTWTIRVPRVPESLNCRLRTHWGAARREKEAWLQDMFYLFNSMHVPKPTGKRRVTITRFAHGILDKDNLAAAYKEVVVDNLKPAKFEHGRYKSGPRKGQFWQRNRRRLGLIVEDDPEWVEVTYLQARVPRNEQQFTIVTIEET